MCIISTSGYALSAFAPSWPLGPENQNFVKIKACPATLPPPRSCFSGVYRIVMTDIILRVAQSLERKQQSKVLG